MSRRKMKSKRWNISFYRDPLHEETEIMAKTADEAIKMFFSVMHDATVEKVWELKEGENETGNIR